MSLPIWTPAALASEARAYRRHVWRLVEAQHRVSTLKLVDTLEEQALLEDLIEATKPALPPEARGLDYLLATPFRYDAPYPVGSRFRRAGRTPGVFYAAETPRRRWPNGLLPPSFLRRVARHALSARVADYTASARRWRRRRHWTLPFPAGARPHGMVRTHRLFRLPVAG